MTEWIKCSDQEPPKEGYFLVFYGDNYFDVMVYSHNDENNKPLYFDRDCMHEDISHWMPLPLPPKKVRNG